MVAYISIKKNRAFTARDMNARKRVSFLLSAIFITVHILVNPSCRINKLHLTGIEGMASIRYFKLNKWIFFSVFPYNSVTRMSRRLA